MVVNLREQVNEFLTILNQKDGSDRAVNMNKTEEWEVDNGVLCWIMYGGLLNEN